jgi:cytidylate kinase
VLDGRDIGTVIAPNACAKLFVTARPDIRAARRWRQLGAQGERVPIEAVMEDIRVRDLRDSRRSDAPLIQAHDAVLLDTSDMSIEEAADAARRIVETARARRDNPEG